MAAKTRPRVQLRGESWRELLQQRPRHRPGLTEDPQPEGALNVTLPLPRPRWYFPPISWLIPLRERRIVGLTGIGLSVWEWCDGSRTLEEIIDLFALRHRLTFHEARASVFSYCKLLTEKGILLMTV